MEAKLIKVDTGWILMVDNKIYASHNDILSLKNCQAIERGYDLDELLKKEIANGKLHPNDGAKKEGIERGIQIALEIFGDKKFSEKELTMLFAYGHQIGMNDVLAIQSQHSPQPMPKPDSDKLRDELIQSLQQTEWDVEVLMENSLINGYRNQAEGTIGFIAEYESVPKLDAAGCLILKRI